MDFESLKNDTDRNFSPTVSWMSKMYDEANDKLFGGKLGECDFSVFTKGAGSQGRTLGWFRITGKVFADKDTKRIFKKDAIFGRIYVDKNCFYGFCKPEISINGNYVGTELSFFTSLVHEMCHYYTYMNGFCPSQGHGREFKDIAAIVTYRSNGLFTIQRLASSEQMSGLELNDTMKEKMAKREANKKASVSAVLRITKRGERQLTMTSSTALIMKIRNGSRDYGDIKVSVSDDPRLIDELFANGYKKNMRTWRYWTIDNYQWIDDLFSKYDSTDLFVNENKMRNIKHIIKEVIDEYVSSEANDGSIEITPDMNLGEFSPMEA